MSQCLRGLKANREGGVNKSVKAQLLGCQSVDVSVCKSVFVFSLKCCSSLTDLCPCRLKRRTKRNRLVCL